MTMARKFERITAREFLQLDLPDDGWRYELHDGVVVAMTPPGSPHQVLAGRLTGHLFAAKERMLPGCDLRPQAGIAPDGLDGDMAYEADLALTCAPYEPGDQGIVRDPILIVEILSPSTDSKDLERKLPRYKRVTSVMEILYVHTEKPVVLLHRRTVGGWSDLSLGIGETIVLETVGLTLPVAELYRDIRFAR
jgi:Uma2 family endonuclease